MIRSYRRAYLLVFAVMLWCTAVTVLADVPAWQIVPNESTLTFTGTQNNAPVSGKFTTYTGVIHFDPTQLDASNMQIVVDTVSVSTSYQDLTETLKTTDWFDVKQFPQAIFKSNRLTKIGDKTYQMNGTLTIRDKTMPITLTFVQEEYSPTKMQIKGSTILKRTAFGVGQGEWASTNEVKDDVQVNFNLSMVKK